MLDTPALNRMIDELKAHVQPNVEELTKLRTALATAMQQQNEQNQRIKELNDHLRARDSQLSAMTADIQKLRAALPADIGSYASFSSLAERLDHVLRTERGRYTTATSARRYAAKALADARADLQHWIGSMKDLYNNGTLVYAMPALKRFQRDDVGNDEVRAVLVAIQGALNALEQLPAQIAKADAIDAALPDNGIDAPPLP
jgi:DNA repair exonuclease SbcCD ATPase subunit